MSVLRRRSFLQSGVAFGIGGGLVPFAAKAAAFPNQPINFLVPDSGGGSFDSYVREFSKLMMPHLQPSVNVEPMTMPGAGGRAAVFSLLHDKPDGYNIGMVNVPGLFTSQYDKKKGQPLSLDQLTWVANLGRESYGVAVSTKSGITDTNGLRKLASTRPVSFSSTGFGSTDYFATRVFATALGLNFRQVLGYTGSAPTMIAVARGDADAVVHSLPTLTAMQSSGLVRTIFTFQQNAIPGVEDCTSVGKPELGAIYQWRPVAAPPGVPVEIVEVLSDALMAAAKQPEAVAWAKTAGTQLYPLDYKAAEQMVAAQKVLVKKWKSVLT